MQGETARSKEARHKPRVNDTTRENSNELEIEIDRYNDKNRNRAGGLLANKKKQRRKGAKV